MLNGLSAKSRDMPQTIEIRCTADDCFLDMFENHYTYEVPDEHDVTNLVCPVCESSASLDPIEL